ncbi:hypothetical protein KFZ58_13835 [Virgibacillus sp. NKC19-16]|uniref:hypothetical protein n=1 Tax=Virgibacillus salidurans TaxID=2831673 RepID=UPI001F19C9F7|nr:hypothetical protein [Virgibacillus sp. NKC19-16]UJL45477.1 hypothetical protein KFZ58_13835 [Virgibacillus sp. NKC19-16]
MKKVAISIVISCLLLSGCLNQASARVVEDMYNAALTGDKEYVHAVFAENDAAIDENLDEVMEQLASQVEDMQGTKNMGIRELRNRHLQDDLIENLDETYDENWYLVVARLGDDTLALWTLQSDGYYYVADHKEMSNDAYNEEILD